MPDSLPALEARRSRILLEIARLGDFRRGFHLLLPTAAAASTNCACAQDDHPGHGPQLRLSYKRRGKDRPADPL